MSGQPEDAPRHPRIVRPRWGGTLLVCGKCLKRHDDGKALRRAIKAEAKARVEAMAGGIEGKKRRKPRIVKTACLGLCPRGAVVVASGAMLSDGTVMLVRDAGEIADAVQSLLPG